MSSTFASTDVADASQSTIIFPPGEIDPHVLESQVQNESAAALREGRVRMRAFPDLFGLSIRHMLSESERLLDDLPRITLDAELSMSVGWPARLKNRLRRVLDRLILYYVLKLAQQQSHSGRQFQAMWAELARHVQVQEQEQREATEHTQVEVARLRTEIQALKAQVAAREDADHAG